MDTSERRPLRMMIVYARGESGFHLVVAPAVLPLEQVEAALREFGIEVEQMFQSTDWKTSSDDVAVARVPFPGGSGVVVGAGPTKKLPPTDGSSLRVFFGAATLRLSCSPSPSVGKQANGTGAEEDEGGGFGHGRQEKGIGVARSGL